MLTQKMSKEALFIAKGINVEKNKENLKKTSELFDKTLKGLIDGDKDLNLLKTENKEILAQLNKVKELWSSFKANIDQSHRWERRDKAKLGLHWPKGLIISFFLKKEDDQELVGNWYCLKGLGGSKARTQKWADYNLTVAWENRRNVYLKR